MSISIADCICSHIYITCTRDSNVEQMIMYHQTMIKQYFNIP